MRIPALLACLLLLWQPAAQSADSCASNELATDSAGCIPVWYGQTPGGGYYTIAIPANWTPDKGLVLWNHGFQSYLTGASGNDLADALALNTVISDWSQQLTGAVQPQPGLGPWRDIVLAQGYAMAASSYNQTGWAVFDSHQANAELYAVFAALVTDTLKFTIPTTGVSPFYLIGASLGGIVTMRDLEAGLLPQVDGALLACGAVAGADNWRHAFDTRMLYDAVCAGSGSALPTPWYEVPGVGAELKLVQALEACTALGSRLLTEKLVAELQKQITDLGTIDSVSKQLLLGLLQNQQSQLLTDWRASHTEESARLTRLLELTSIPTGEFLALDLWYAVFELPRLINDPAKLAGRIPFHNAAVDYGDDALNWRITRSVALPSFRAALQANFTPTGSIGKAKILAIHTTQDGLVKVENTLALTSIINREQLTTALVNETTPSHCGFTVAEGTSAWNQLRAWVETGAGQPSAQTLQATCTSAANTQDCRFDPDIAIIAAPVVQYPRPAAGIGAGANRFDAGTGKLTLEIVRDPESGNEVTATLVPTDETLTRFTVQSVTGLLAPVSGWAPTAILDFAVEAALAGSQPGALKLYVPAVQILNNPDFTARYNLYFQRVSDTDLQLLEAEVVPD